MSGPLRYDALVFTSQFLETFASKDFSSAEQRQFLKALSLLQTNERHPSLRVHQLQGNLAGLWSASASDQLRIIFERVEGGRKALIACSRHYQR